MFVISLYFIVYLRKLHVIILPLTARRLEIQITEKIAGVYRMIYFSCSATVRNLLPFSKRELHSYIRDTEPTSYEPWTTYAPFSETFF